MMKSPLTRTGGSAMGLALGISLAAALTACTPATDMSGVQAERGKSIKRYDIGQALAANGKVVVGATQNGAVLVSADQGKTWQRTELGQVSIIDLKTCPDGSFVGIDFYHQVWSADAAGANWKGTKLEQIKTPLSLACDPKGRWWVTGPGARIAVSADKGATWTLTDLAKDAQLTAIQFVDEATGYAAGEFGMLLATKDGGATWASAGTTDKDFYPYAALFKNANEGWVSGIAGKILHTEDGGKTWTRQTNTAGAALYRLFLHEGVPYGTGAGGIVARLEGNEWRSLPYPDPLPVFLGASASLPTQSAVALGGPGGLLRVVSTKTAP